MIPGIEAAYQVVAEEIEDALPGPWQHATIDGVYYPESEEFNGEFLNQSGELECFRISIKVMKTFRQLREKFKKAGHRVWGQVSFRLYPDGTFNVKWGYDNCDENGTTIWDPDEWSRQQDERRDRHI